MKHSVYYIFLIFLCLFVFSPLGFAQTDQHTDTNVDIFKKMTDQVVDSVLNTMTLDSTRIIVLNSQSKQHEGNWLIENAFVQDVFKKGGKIRINESCLDKTESQFKLEYNIEDFDLQYLPTSQKKRTKRQFDIKLNVRCLNCADGSIQFLREFVNQFSDTVKTVQLKKLENNNYQFARDEIKIDKGFKKYLEPFIVLSTTGVVIYLFYIMRSK